MAVKYNQQNDQTRQIAGLPLTGTREERLRQRIEGYVWDDDPNVQEHIEWFLDQKLGLMIHWGVYSQLGMKESWPLIDHSSYGNNPKWTRWQFPEDTDPKEFKAMYSNLHKTFNPVRFDPDEWAEFAKDAGFKYLLFTTKHHDGFCMWDTKVTNYSVTGPESPYRNNNNADIARRLFDSFRARGMGISVYFSKPDWMCPYYWEPGYILNNIIKDGRPSYDVKEKTELWEKFVQYTHEQLRELGLHSGRIDCMWFDGGVVSKHRGLDLRIDEIMDELRKSQPWLLSADRSQGGKYENFLTPELEIPETVLPVPWETCLCLGKKMEGEIYTSFGYTYDQNYYSPSETLHIFLEVISRGGNLALNIGPQPDGRLPVRAMKTLRIFGHWLKICEDGIYGTRPCEPYFDNEYRYLKKGNQKFVYRLYEDNETVPLSVSFKAPFEVNSVNYMRTGQSLDFTQTGDILNVKMPLGIVGLSGIMADGFNIK